MLTCPFLHSSKQKDISTVSLGVVGFVGVGAVLQGLVEFNTPAFSLTTIAKVRLFINYTI